MSERLTGGDQGRWDMRYRAYVGVVFGLAYRYKLMLALVGLGLATRLPLLSISLDEVDAAAYFNALKYGYNISEVHPHPPGNPVYVFMAGLLNVPLQDPLLSLTLLSALFGSIAVVPFNLLLKELGLPRAAVLAGSLFFIFNPLLWAYSEAALSDVPAMFFAITLAYLCFRARRSDAAFLAAAIVASLLLGVRTAYNPLLVLLCFPIVYRLVRYRATGVIRLFLVGALLFTLVSLVWAIPMIVIGGPGFGSYVTWLGRVSDMVGDWSIVEVGPPWASNIFFRVVRFASGYFLTYPWTGSGATSALGLLLILPWLFGFALFFVNFSHRRAGHVFVLLWLMCVIYPIMHIVFISRYGIATLPAFIIAAIVGYTHLLAEIRERRFRLAVSAASLVASVFILISLRLQPSVFDFEFKPFGVLARALAAPWARDPSSETIEISTLFLLAGIGLLVVSRFLDWTPQTHMSGVLIASIRALSERLPLRASHLQYAFLFLLVMPYALRGHSVASVAHNTVSPPPQRVVEYIGTQFDASKIDVCWDISVQVYFEALRPEIVPRFYQSLAQVRRAVNSGRTVLATQYCHRWPGIAQTVGLQPIARFQGDSVLWGKSPVFWLYRAPTRGRGG